MANLTFIGTGYVGLVSGSCMAEIGHNVTCMDVDAKKINALKDEGIIPIYEPGLEAQVKANVAARRMDFTTDLSTCVPNSDAVFIGVGTPQSETGEANLSYVYQAAADIAPHLKNGALVVVKSTVPLGTNRKVKQIIEENNPNVDFDVASNPEFLREGKAVDDFMKPDRIVAGVESERAENMMKELYKPLTDAGYPLFITHTLETSELIKYAANTFLAAKITFINEVAALCEEVGADVAEVSTGMGLDKRIGAPFLSAGPGYGGSCFPKDTHALAYIAKEMGVPLNIVNTTIETNHAVKLRMVDKVVKACEGDVKGKKIAVLGLAFKAGTDDMREAASLTILPELKKLGANVVAHDPQAMERASELMPELEYNDDMMATLAGADAVLILTEWDEFKSIDWNAVKASVAAPLVIDLRNLFEPKAMKKLGFAYHSLGRAAVKPCCDCKCQSAA